MKTITKSLFVFTLIINSVFSNLLAQNIATSSVKLENNSDWNVITDGSAVTSPVQIPGGYVFALDGGSFQALSENGKIIWRKMWRKFSKDFSFASSKYGILYFYEYAYARHYLNILSSAGIVLKRIKIDEKADFVVPGDDGRVFLFGSKSISCYGTNGVCKWKINNSWKVDKTPILLCDGSVLFLTGTQAVKISKYGESRLFSFNYQPLKAACSENSLYIIFNNKVVKKFDKNKFGEIEILQEVSVQNGITQNELNKNAEFYLPKEITFDLTNKDVYFGITGQSSNRFVKTSNSKKEDFVLAFQNQLICFTIDFTESPKNLKNQKSPNNLKTLASKNQKTQEKSEENQNVNRTKIYRKVKVDVDFTNGTYALTNGNQLLISCPTWENVFFKFAPNPEFNMKVKAPKPVYGSLNSRNIEEKSKSLSKGNYSENEKTLSEEIFETLQAYQTYSNTIVVNKKDELIDFSDNRNFAQNKEYVAEVFRLSGNFGTDAFTDIYANMILRETSDEILPSILEAAGNSGFDNNYAIYKAIEARLSKSDQLKNVAFVNSACDALFKLGKTMGLEYSKKVARLLSKNIEKCKGSTQKHKMQNTFLQVKTLMP